MDNRVLFLIIGSEVKYLQNSNMDHREWFVSLGYDPASFDSVVRGYVIGKRILFFKGAYQYDDEVIRAAKMFTPNIRFTMNDTSLEAWCGIVFQGTNWEPIVRIQDNEITGFHPTTVSTPVEEKELEPVLELKNDYQDDAVSKRALIVTAVVFVICLVTKIVLFSKGLTLQLSHFTDILLAGAQLGILVFAMISFAKKKENSKYLGFIASILMIFTFDIVDIILGILYFIFCVDQSYFIKLVELIKNLISKNKGNKSA